MGRQDRIRMRPSRQATVLAMMLAIAWCAPVDAASTSGGAADAIDSDNSIFDETPGIKPSEPRVKLDPAGNPNAPRPELNVSGAPQRPPETQRLPIPNAAAIAKAKKLVHEVFSADYARRNPRDRTALAQKLIRNAAEVTDDPTPRFVLLSEARDLAAAAGNIALAQEAIAELDRHYVIDRLVMTADALAAVARMAKSRQEGEALLEAWVTVLEQALIEARCSLAVRAADGAEAALRFTKDRALITKVRENARVARALRKIEQTADGARDTLATNPDDPAANLALGHYLCFVHGNWKEGLPLLAKGTPDLALKQLIRQDLANPQDATDQAELAEAWWSLSRKQVDPAQRAYRARAVSWYQHALSEASGLLKVKIEQRLAKISDETGETPFARISRAMKSGAIVKTDRAGTGGGGAFEHTPETGGILTGFIVTAGQYFGAPVVGAVQPIYETAEGRVIGERFANAAGGGGPEIRVEAKRGYAVGGITAKFGNCLDGFRVVFMRILPDGTGLDPADRYESKWICGRGGGPEVSLGLNGKFVIGIHGGTGSDFDGMGLIQVK